MTSPMPTKQQPPQLTQAEMDAAMTAAKRLLEKARAFIVLDYPFFATIMLKHPMVARFDIPTLAVSAKGTIYYNPAFVAQQSTEQIVWAICHEVLHYASGHAIRRGQRDHKKWNYAGDMWINDTLNDSGVGQKIPGCVDVPGSKDRTVEDIYASFPPDDPDGPDGDGPNNGNNTGQGNDPLQGDIESDDNLSDSDKAEIDGNRKIEISEAAQVAKMKGKLPGVLQKFAEDTVQSKTPWYDILERYMTERCAVDQSWARPNRRYAPDFYLPSIADGAQMGEVVIQVDISGSVSRQEIRHYNGHMKRIVEQCRPSKVHVIYTDTAVQTHEVFDKPEDVEIQFYSGGGTDMCAGFEYIADKGIEPEVVVTLTDGYTPFPESTDVPSIWCISSHEESPVGVNIHFDLNEE